MRGVPWLTHVAVMIGLTLWLWLVTLEQYGVDSSAGWWDPGDLHRSRLRHAPAPRASPPTGSKSP